MNTVRPYSQQAWGNTQKDMLNQYKERFEFGGFVIGPDEELMIIRHPIDGLLPSMQEEATVESQTGLHIRIADLRSGVRNLILSKTNGSTNDGNYLEAYELTAAGGKPASFARLTASGVFTDASARELKDNIRDLTEPQIKKILKGAKMYRFNYLKEPDVVHVGPMADEFYSLTGWGDDTTVAPKTLAGIALRLVQWVWEKVEDFGDRIAKIETYEQRIADLEAREARIVALEAQVAAWQQPAAETEE